MDEDHGRYCFDYTDRKKKFRLNGHVPTKFQRVAFEHTGIAVAKIGEVDTNLADHVAG